MCRHFFHHISRESDSIYHSLRYLIPDPAYWQKEETHFSTILRLALEYFDELDPPVSVKRLAEHPEYPPVTVLRALDRSASADTGAVGGVQGGPVPDPAAVRVRSSARRRPASVRSDAMFRGRVAATSCPQCPTADSHFPLGRALRPAAVQ